MMHVSAVDPVSLNAAMDVKVGQIVLIWFVSSVIRGAKGVLIAANLKIKSRGSIRTRLPIKSRGSIRTRLPEWEKLLIVILL